MTPFLLSDYICDANTIFGNLQTLPWEIINNIESFVQRAITLLDPEVYEIHNDVAIHKSAIIEQNVIIKGPVIIGKNCFVAANCYFRPGVYLCENVKVGPSTEIKSSIIFADTAIAHLNYVGNSIIGSNVNIEGGAVLAVHYNERQDKEISVVLNNEIINTKAIKFGSLIGDNSRIGANAVTSPGTILKPSSVVARLELVDQVTDFGK
jgi:UDP-N-acetylglucosamine diphosphorylase / glucose-1-phosphate thymidylyltransferase / UDP-N-acetylgalactosamine diphosphorylase / glucosamine-1-phosphate N-acetyltransferase / galactosamine-1-phosphate N-acetyltransferase